MTVTARLAPGNTAWWCVTLLLCLVLLAPLTLVDVPPLLDYPNHLARLFALAFLPTDPILARFYEARWGIIPNLGLDLTVPPLLRLFPVHVVGRAVIGLTLLLPVAGAVAYHRALTGRLSYWPLGTVLFAYNAALLRGFLNFVASVGLALLLGAAWVAWRERRPALTIAIGAVGAVVLFFCHLTGLLMFAILIGGHELAWLRAVRFRISELPRRSVAAIVVFAAPAILYAVSDLRGMQGAPVFRSVAGKAHAALMPVLNYLWPLDLLTAGLCVVGVVLCLALRWCTSRFQAVVAIAVLLALFAGLPTAFKGTFDLDTRFIVMAAFTIPAAFLPAAPPRGAARVIGVVFLLLFAARMVVVLAVWHDWAADLAAFRGVIASVQPGDVVLTVRTQRPNVPASIMTPRRLSDGTVVDAHLPALLLIERRAWWPYLFDNLSQQPIRTREPYRTAAWLADRDPDPIGLLIHGDPRMLVFTHVLVIGPDPPDITRGALRLLARNQEVALYAVAINPPRPSSPLSGR